MEQRNPGVELLSSKEPIPILCHRSHGGDHRRMDPSTMKCSGTARTFPQPRSPSASKVPFIVIRISLGIVFLVATADKILHPAPFSRILHNYQILPSSLVNLAAIILPWTELLLGLFLLAGWWLYGTVLLSGALFTVFLGALAFNAARGLDIHCGCFSTSLDAGGGIAWNLVRDLGFWVMALYLGFQLFRKGQPPGTGRQGEDPGCHPLT